MLPDHARLKTRKVRLLGRPPMALSGRPDGPLFSISIVGRRIPKASLPPLTLPVSTWTLSSSAEPSPPGCSVAPTRRFRAAAPDRVFR